MVLELKNMTLELPETIDLASKAHPAGKKKANINRESEKKKKRFDSVHVPGFSHTQSQIGP